MNCRLAKSLSFAVFAIVVVLWSAVSAGSTYGSTAYGQLYDQSDWVKFGCTTYPLNLSSSPQYSGVQNSNLVYNPAKMWDDDPRGDSYYFDGYYWTKTTYTDSAAAVTALSTGQKSYNNAINWSDFNTAIIPTIVEFASNLGKKTGTISSVEFSHATPAGMSNAHNSSRNNYSAIALQMVYGTGGSPSNPSTPVLDVIMGCGHPGYNNNGSPASFQSNQYVGGTSAWSDMGGGSGGTTSSGFQVFHTKAAFEALTTSNTTSGRYLGIPQVYTTLQQARSGASSADDPYDDPLISTVPSLETMTKAALNILDGTSGNPNEEGFFLHVEGGAVDWANHANTLGRMIEEQIDFNNSIQAVDDYLDANTNGNNWSNTLVILTSDHECGFLLGPDAQTEAFDQLEIQDAGEMPLHRYMSGSHTNSLVPLYAKGPGSELFASLVDGTDSEMVDRYGLWQGFDGQYVDNTDIFTVATAAFNGDTKNVIMMTSDGAGFNTWTATTGYQYGQVPEPSTFVLLGSAIFAAVLMRQRRRQSRS